MTVGSGVLLVLLSLSGALRVSCASRPGRSAAQAARGRPRSRRGAHSPGGAFPGFPGPRRASPARAPLHPAGSRAPRSRLRSAGARSRRVSGERRCGAECGTRGALPEADPPSIPQPPQVRGRCPGARLSRAGAGCPLAEPASPPSPARRAPPELASPARARAENEGSWRRPAGNHGVGDTRSGRPCWGPVLPARRRIRRRSLGAGRDRRCWWAADVDRGAISPRTSRGAGCSQCSAGPSRLGAGPESQAPGRSRVRCTRERGPGARLLPAEPRELCPQPCAAPAGCRSRGQRAGCAGGRPWGKAAGPRELQEPPLVADRPRCSSKGLAVVTSEINKCPRSEARSEARGAWVRSTHARAGGNFPGRVSYPRASVLFGASFPRHGAAVWSFTRGGTPRPALPPLGAF